ncbi:uncharacterized protein LOC142897794 [Nelusetta ayraudi]|uniref:uncharacterized protein LOC142897794 n=1 Tax=Nelusetta ayraudi TaxID=303726 RepID=UPI003F709100
MPRLRNFRSKEAARKRILATFGRVAKIKFPAQHGTGHRQTFLRWPVSLLTDKKCRVVAPAQHPDKKTVLVVGDGQLRALVCGVVPQGRVSFGFLCVYKATTSDLKTEVIHANIPWTPDAVCVCVPMCNIKQSIPKAVQHFEALLATVCFRWPKVFVLDFPPVLTVDPIRQDAIRQEFRSVTESVGLTYVPVAEHFPSHRLELWCYDGVHLSEDGATILLQLLQDAAEQQLAVCAPLPETSVVGQCDVEETSPPSVAVSGAPLPAEPQASCQAVISGGVSTPVNADHPEATVAVQFQSVNGWMTPGCPHPEYVFGPSRPKRSEKPVCRFKFDRKCTNAERRLHESMSKETTTAALNETSDKGRKGKKRTRKGCTRVHQAQHGTGPIQPRPQGLCSLLTDKRCRVVAPAQHPDKKTVLVVGDGQLGALVSGVVNIPEGRVSFGFLCVYKATTSDLKTEVIHANIPWTPDAVCVCVPMCNVKQYIPKAVQDFEALLATVCFRWPKVFVLDFPTDLIADPIRQDAIRQEYRSVCESVGLTYVPVAEHFPSHRLELWCYDGVHLSEDGGVPILLQLLQDAADQQLAVCAPLPETSVVGQCDVEETSPDPDPDAPVISGDVTTTVDADHPETTVVAQFQQSVNGWMTPECKPEPSEKRIKYDVILKGYKSKREKRRMNVSKKRDAALNETSDKGCDPRWTAREERLDMQEKKLKTPESVNGQITPECKPEPSEKRITLDVMLRNPIFKRELRVNIFKMPTIAALDKTPDEGLDHASHESEEHAQLATMSKTTATAALEEKSDEEFVPMSEEQLDMQEKELNTLEVKLLKKRKALEEDAQKLQRTKDRVANQKQRIVRLKRELGAKDIEIRLLKEELQLSRRPMFSNPESLY